MISRTKGSIITRLRGRCMSRTSLNDEERNEYAESKWQCSASCETKIKQRSDVNDSIQIRRREGRSFFEQEPMCQTNKKMRRPAQMNSVSQIRRKKNDHNDDKDLTYIGRESHSNSLDQIKKKKVSRTSCHSFGHLNYVEYSSEYAQELGVQEMYAIFHPTVLTARTASREGISVISNCDKS